MFSFDIKVLVVDDFTTMRSIVRTLLRQIGFKHIDEAEDGIKALQQLRKASYGLVVSDWNMPNMEGIELLKAVRKDPQLQDLPFLMVTAENEKEKVVEAIKAKVDNYIVKPFTADTLRDCLNKIAEKRGLS